MSLYGNFFSIPKLISTTASSTNPISIRSLRNCRLLISLQRTQEYSALAELHCDLHSLLAEAGQVSTGYSKTQYLLLQALQNDPAGKYAIHFSSHLPCLPFRTVHLKTSSEFSFFMHQRSSPRLSPSATPTLWPLLALRLQWQPLWMPLD